MQRHVTLLGAFFIAYGIMGIIVGMAVVLAVFYLGIVPMHFHYYHGLHLPHIVGLLIAGIIAIFHLPALVVGWGLMQRCSWARIPALIVGAVNLVSLPFGTALGIYALWVLLQEETVQYLNGTQAYRTT